MKNQVEITESKHIGVESYKVYKIRRKADGLFSTGGSYPSFNGKGKEWYTLAAVGSHLAITANKRCYSSYCDTGHAELEIVTMVYEVHKSEIATQGVDDYNRGLLQRREKRIAAQDRAKARRRMESAKRDLESAAKRLSQLQGNAVDYS